MPSLRQEIDAAVQAAVQAAITGGSHRCYEGQWALKLEQALAGIWTGSQALLTCSGTAALTLALKAAGIGNDDEVILAGYDYPGNFWAIEQAGATPVLVDVDSNSTCVDLSQLSAAFTTRTKMCVISHLHGQIQPVEQIRELTQKYGVLMVEDVCQAVGATFCYQQQTVPAGTVGDFAIASFGGSKVLSAGRGGVLMSSNSGLMQKAKIAIGSGSGAFRLSEIGAAIVHAQLPFLSRINSASTQLFQAINQNSDADVQAACLASATTVKSAYYQAGWVMPSETARAAAVERLTRLGVAAGQGFTGFHRRSPRRCRIVGELTNTRQLVDRILLVHHSTAMDNRISVQQLAQVISNAIAGREVTT